MDIKFKYIGNFEAPKIQTAGSAGLDLFNNEDTPKTVIPGKSVTMDTGFYVEIPEGYVGLVFARSSLGFKFDCTLSNSVGVIDSDYRGEVKVKIHNNSDSIKFIMPGERVAQLVVVPCLASYKQVEELSETERGANGFGSTGKKVSR